MSRFIMPLSAKEARRESVAGGKASVLARLMALGVRIPDGFVVGTPVFRLMEQHCGGGSASPETPGLRTFLKTAPFPPHVEREIAAAYRALGGAVAVRSSLVGEDAAEASFAGQLESFLDIEGNDRLLEAIRACFASALAERIRLYRDGRSGSGLVDAPGSRSRRVSMAVLVQHMVRAEAAGVAFGADPATGRFCVVIEAVRGTGRSVVGGREIPDRYVIGQRGDIVEARRAPGASAALDESQVRELAGIVRDLERRLDAPLDVEWARDASGYFVLQARPISSLAGASIYSRAFAADMAPGVITPLMWSTSILDMTRNVFGRLFATVLGRRDFDTAALVKLIHSRVYANVTLFAALLARAGLPVNLFEAIGRDEPALRPRFVRSLRAVPALVRLVFLVMRHGRLRSRAASFIVRREQLLERLHRRSWSELEPRALFAEATELRRAHGETQWFMWMTAVNTAVRRKMVSSFLRRRAPQIDPAALLAGRDELRSLAPNLRLAEIAAAMRCAGAGAVEAAARGDDAAVREHCARVVGGDRVVLLFDRFLERFGHLGARGTDFSVAPWGEMPGMLWQAIAREAGSRADGDASAARHRCAHAGPRDSSPVDGNHGANDPDASPSGRRSPGERLPDGAGLRAMERFVLRRLLDSTFAYLMLRDRMSYLMSGDAYQARRIYLAMGAAFARAGALERQDDVFFLEFEEIGRLIDRSLPAAAARDLVRARRSVIAADERVDPENIVFGESHAGETEPVAAGEYLEGIAGSAGIVRGFARIVLDPAAAVDAPRRADVLVVPFMDIGWTPLFSGIGGIVAEAGGQLSHSAIVAREYGIPAVVAVVGATRIIREGQPLTVDGTRGRVYLSHV